MKHIHSEYYILKAADYSTIINLYIIIDKRPLALRTNEWKIKRDIL